MSGTTNADGDRQAAHGKKHRDLVVVTDGASWSD
jgi:hypothetical protein